MSLINFRDDVFALTQELQNKTDYTETRVDHYINRGVWDFVRRTNCIEDRIDITSVANQFEYSQSDAPSLGRVYKINEVRWIESGVSEVGKPLLPYPGGYGNLPEQYQYGTPGWYWTRGMQSEDISSNNAKRIGVWPIDGSSGNTIRLHVFRFPLSDLSSDGDTPEIQEAWYDAVVYFAAYRMFKNYAHEKKQWLDKMIMLKASYMELVQDFNYNAATEGADRHPTIIDVYEDC